MNSYSFVLLVFGNLFEARMLEKWGSIWKKKDKVEEGNEVKDLHWPKVRIKWLRVQFVSVKEHLKVLCRTQQQQHPLWEMIKKKVKLI